MNKYSIADPGNNEKILEEDLLLYLFDQGIDNPISTPASASGRADVVGLLDIEDPLVVEIKIVDKSKKYGKNRILSGFSQAVSYSNDYHKNIAYLVIYSLDPVEIQIKTSEKATHWPNRVHCNGKAKGWGHSQLFAVLLIT